MYRLASLQSKTTSTYRTLNSHHRPQLQPTLKCSIHRKNFASSTAAITAEKTTSAGAIIDHEEEHEIVASLEGTPARELERTVIISRPTKNSMQSGLDKYTGWRLYWLREEIWTNPLMGWTSTRDPFTNLKLRFDTKESAVAYARQHGLHYEVHEEFGYQKPPTDPKMYGEHFKYVPPPRDPFEF